MRPIVAMIAASAVAVLAAAAFPQTGRADRLFLRGDFNYFNSESNTTNTSTGATSSNSFHSFNQRYNIDFSKTLYPYLSVSGGSLYELENGTAASQDFETDTTKTILRPFVEANLENPLYRAGLRYTRTQQEDRATGLPATRDTRDEMTAAFGWRPEDFPEVDLRYYYTHTYDDPESVDLLDNRLTFETRYSAWQKLRLEYTYDRNERDNRLKRFDTLEQDHTGRIDYFDDFFDRRLSLSTGYRIFYRTFEFPGSAAGDDTDLALTRDAGLTSQDNTPEDGPALSPLPSLIDGNLTAPTIIDIGLGGDETTLTNIGLDFGFPVNVSKLHLWVDRLLSAPVANSFAWDVYISPDNTDSSTWAQLSGVSAVFGNFDNRFEISFPAVSTRFIKLTVRPLLPAVPDAPNFPNIFVTELQAFTTVAGEEHSNKFVRTDHNYNLNLRGRLGKRTTLGASLFYSLLEEDPSATKTTRLSNDVYLNHVFNRIFSANANASRTERQFTDESSLTYTYGAALRANYLKTLDQVLTYSATLMTDEDGSSDENSIYLRTNAKLYDGWSAFLDTGYRWYSPTEGTQQTSTIIRAGTNVVPSRTIDVNVNYNLSISKQPENPTPQTTTSEWILRVWFTPYRTFTLNVEYNFIDRGTSRTSLQNYSANWSPFPDGTLQFFLTYNEILRPEDGQKSRTLGPSLKWTVSRHVFLDMYYNLNESESSTQTSDSKSFNARLKVTF